MYYHSINPHTLTMDDYATIKQPVITSNSVSPHNSTYNLLIARLHVFILLCRLIPARYLGALLSLWSETHIASPVLFSPFLSSSPSPRVCVCDGWQTS